MVKDGEDFVVYDAKTGDDITRSVLAQIIFEQENKAGQNLLPITFLRQLIRFYGDSMQMLVPSYLEQSIDSLTREQEKFRKQMTRPSASTPFGAARGTGPPQHGDVRADASRCSCRSRAAQARPKPRRSPARAAREADNIDDLRRQMKEMQERLDRMSLEQPKKDEYAQQADARDRGRLRAARRCRHRHGRSGEARPISRPWM